MNDINIFENKDIIMLRRVPKKIYSFKTILILFAVLFLIIGNIEYKKYVTYYAKVIKGNLVLETSMLPNYDTNLYFKDKKYKFEILDIDNNDSYFMLKVNIEKEFLVENNILIIRLVKDETTIIKEIKKMIWKDW